MGRRRGLFLCRTGSFRTRDKPVAQRTELAVFQTVETVHAAAVVYAVGGYIDAGSLAVMLADMAVPALFAVDYRTEKRETREETQRRSHRTDRVAVCAAVFPGKVADNC